MMDERAATWGHGTTWDRESVWQEEEIQEALKRRKHWNRLWRMDMSLGWKGRKRKGMFHRGGHKPRLWDGKQHKKKIRAWSIVRKAGLRGRFLSGQRGHTTLSWLSWRRELIWVPQVSLGSSAIFPSGYHSTQTLSFYQDWMIWHQRQSLVSNMGCCENGLKKSGEGEKCREPWEPWKGRKELPGISKVWLGESEDWRQAFWAGQTSHLAQSCHHHLESTKASLKLKAEVKLSRKQKHWCYLVNLPQCEITHAKYKNKKIEGSLNASMMRNICGE